ncbi:hypothetical protein IGJ28_002013 [Enterococcus sp. AZ091]|uniref:hypothetical protein n=1 Tax=Enterococcus sp. AZ091 TaxID=2774720 RepID=UPI003F1F1DAC
MNHHIKNSECIEIRYIVYYKNLIKEILRDLNTETFDQSVKFLNHIMIKIHHFQELCVSNKTGKSYIEMIRKVEDRHSFSDILENEEIDVLDLFIQIHFLFVSK